MPFHEVIMDIELEPILMPYQNQPFNGDTYICDEFLRIRDEFDIQTVIELGSCVGGTTKWCGENFTEVYTIEINPSFRSYCLLYTEHLPNVTSLLGNTVDILPSVLDKVTDNTLIFIDSHWLENCPMLDELRLIAEKKKKPCVCIHDFKVANHPELGFDSYKGQDFEISWIKPSLDNIYGIDNYRTYYNNGCSKDSACRGVIYIVPIIKADINLETIEKIVINLPERNERLSRTKSELKKVFTNTSFTLVEGIRDIPIYKGIAQAHINAVQIAKSKGWRQVLIMEDDIFFPSRFFHKYITEALQNTPEDWDILLASVYKSKGLIKYNEYWSRTKDFSGLTFYIVNEKVYQAILEFDKSGHIDRAMVTELKLNCYVINNFVAIQYDGFSDNTGKEEEYSKLLINFEILK